MPCLCSDLQILTERNGPVDIMHLHVARAWKLHTSWRVVAEQYKTIMRDPDHINFVTLFRDPRSHFLSFYYYFLYRHLGHVRASGCWVVARHQPEVSFLPESSPRAPYEEPCTVTNAVAKICCLASFVVCDGNRCPVLSPPYCVHVAYTRNRPYRCML